MDFEKLAEEKIREAIERGEFNGLDGARRKIDLTGYFNTPAEFRVGYSLLKSNRSVPGEGRLLREIGDLKAKIDEGTKDNDALVSALNEKRMALAMILERNRSGLQKR